MDGVKIEAFTYYRSTDNRVFLVADVDLTGIFNYGAPRVVLFEWGKPREQPQYVLYDLFVQQVQERKLLPYFPSL